MRRNFWFLIVTLVLVVGTFLATLMSGNSPVLGLDLQGGISVVLAPVGEVKNEASLDKAVDIIRSRVDALGVAEPEISVATKVPTTSTRVTTRNQKLRRINRPQPKGRGRRPSGRPLANRPPRERRARRRT
jgi:preprotein translocase subunit SecD